MLRCPTLTERVLSLGCGRGNSRRFVNAHSDWPFNSRRLRSGRAFSPSKKAPQIRQTCGFCRSLARACHSGLESAVIKCAAKLERFQKAHCVQTQQTVNKAALLFLKNTVRVSHSPTKRLRTYDSCSLLRCFPHHADGSLSEKATKRWTLRTQLTAMHERYVIIQALTHPTIFTH